MLPLFICGLLSAIVAFNSQAIIYLLAIVSPFYEYFPETFLKIGAFKISFTLKPFLFLTILLIINCLARLLLTKKLYFLRFTLLHKIIFLSFSFFCLISFYFALITKSAYMTEINMLFNVSLILFIPYFYWEKDVDLKIILVFINVIVFLISLYSIIFHFFLSHSAYFTISKQSGFCTFLMMTFPFVVFSFFSAKGKLNLFFAVITLILSFNALIISLSRSGFAGVMLTLPLFLLFSSIFSKKKIVQKRALLIIFIIFFIIAFDYYCFPSVRIRTEIVKSVLDTSQTNIYKDPIAARIDNTYIRNLYLVLAHERTIVWRESIKLFLSAPFKGYGLNHHVVTGLMGAHNTLITVLVASGAIGFSLFLLAFASFFAYLIKKIKTNASWQKKVFFLAIFSSVISLFIQGMLQTVINEYIIWFVVLLAFIDHKPSIIEPPGRKEKAGE